MYSKKAFFAMLHFARAKPEPNRTLRRFKLALFLYAYCMGWNARAEALVKY